MIALGDFLRMLLFYGINLSHMDLELSDLEKKMQYLVKMPQEILYSKTDN